MPYTLKNLGAYNAYSEDPRIVDGVVLAGRDRPSGTAFHTHAAIWSGDWTRLPDPASGTDWSVALGGTADHVVGYITPDAHDSLSRAALWQKRLGEWAITALPLPTNAISSVARSICADGLTIVGEVQDTDEIQYAAIWKRAGIDWQVEILPQVDIRGYAVGIDAKTGDIIGTVLDRPSWHAIRWQQNGAHWITRRLGMPGSPAGAPSSVITVAEATQDGLILGSAGVIGGPSEAGFWTSAGDFTELGAGPGTSANGHANGTVVGVDNSDPDMPTAFVWTADTGREDLHPSGWDWSLATSIDPTSGEIVGVMGMGPHGQYGGDRAIFLMQPD